MKLIQVKPLIISIENISMIDFIVELAYKTANLIPRKIHVRLKI